MFSRFLTKSNNKAEGESPFWISFADLMTALMTLFLVVMSVTLIAVTQSIPSAIAQESARQQDIKSIMSLLKDRSKKFGKVYIDEANYKIDLGEIVRFESGSSTINERAARFLRSYLPILLKVKKTQEGRWIKRYVIEGFTDQDGTYMYNLNLSLKRSLSVICALAPKNKTKNQLSKNQLEAIQESFLVGGFSFNSIKKNKAASRRVEIIVEFWQVGEKEKSKKDILINKDFGVCSG